MSRASRLLDLLQILRRHQSPVAGSVLAKELGISLRSLYRDIATLQAQGANIQGEAGLGYVLRPGFTLPPLMFSIEELESLVLGSRWVAQRGDERLATAANNAVAKIRAVLPVELRDTIDVATSFVPSNTGERIAIDASVLRAAIRAERKVLITYRDGDGSGTTRTVWPFLIGVFDRVQVLAAWCELRNDFRAFRIDRIASVQRTDTALPRRRSVLIKEWRAKQNLSTSDGS